MSAVKKMKFASILSVVLCVVLTVGFVIGGGDFKGPGIVVYFVLLALCLAIAVGLALDDPQ